MSFDLILPFLRPIEPLLLDEWVSEIMGNPDPTWGFERDGIPKSFFGRQNLAPLNGLAKPSAKSRLSGCAKHTTRAHARAAISLWTDRLSRCLPSGDLRSRGSPGVSQIRKSRGPFLVPIIALEERHLPCIEPKMDDLVVSPALPRSAAQQDDGHILVQNQSTNYLRSQVD